MAVLAEVLTFCGVPAPTIDSLMPRPPGAINATSFTTRLAIRLGHFRCRDHAEAA